MEVLPEVEPEMEGAEQEEAGEDEGLRDLQELEEMLSRVHVAPRAPHLLEPDPGVDQREWPSSYRENSSQENLLLAMAENVRCQYAHLYPDRRPLFLCPENECGVKKFVSTTLRPTLLPIPELYHWQGCASFVSDFLSLELLDPPIDLPKQLRSPTWVLKTQRGSCFDFSTLLCSLLLGAGYDAYCVSGYAVKEMCLLNQSHQECPLLRPSISEEVAEQKQEVRRYSAKAPRDLQRYSVKAPRDLRSSFELRQAEACAVQLRTQQDAQGLREESESPPPDPLYGLRIHCWVLVLPGNREVPDSFFIEPLTGQSYPTTSNQFLGIECIWNQQNYWVNMQDCRFGCAEMTYDLGDPVKWEYLLCSSMCQSLLLVPDTKRQHETEDEDEEEEAKEEQKVFHMPPSWVMKIHISREDMENRCPGGRKLIRYRKATVEMFAPYLLKNGLVRKLTTYDDLDCTQANTVTEWYRHRHDQLQQREPNKASSVTLEQFNPGRSYALKSHRYVTLLSETERQMDFYSHARPDSLARRVETPCEMTETFDSRPDFLYYRHVVFSKRVGTNSPGGTPEQRPVQKVVERFHRDRSKPAAQDVAERVFLLSEDRIQVTYHREEDRIIPAWQDFVKPHNVGTSQIPHAFTPQMVSTFQVDPSEKPCKNLLLYETLMALMKEEENVLIRIRESENEVRAILAAREQEESTIELQISIYDTARNEKAGHHREELERTAEEERLRREEEKELDVLAPFLARHGDPESLTREQALQIRADCLSHLKQRLISRANRIQSCFEKETQELQQKQLWYQKNEPTMTKDDEDSYLSYCSDALFRIEVLKLRLSRHKDGAAQRYLALDERLKQDPRLALHLS
ncbi:dynein regulatory complex subunit 7 [Electrophorus electricus]|uniref:dynein regulatory complex subunit 7 n=1 Tax=Electrophorus electricus TaxID=8005 RepID=UPI0015CFFE8C|nr:dynein regulatory complex subunit 7 [Electrophorus electricus]